MAFVISLSLQVLYLACALPAVVVNGSTAGTDASWWAALVALAAWALVIERLVAGFWPKLGRFMIGENVATVVPWAQLTDVNFHRPPLVALLALLTYLAAVVTAATALFARRDVATT